jgi:hypothetical protein
MDEVLVLYVSKFSFSDLWSDVAYVTVLLPLVQVLQSTIYEVDLDRILQSIHLYLQDLGMEEIRRRYLLYHLYFIG